MIAACMSSVAGPSAVSASGSVTVASARLERAVVVEVVLVGEARGGVGRRGSAWALKATVAASPSSTASPVSVAVGATLSTSIVVVYARRPSSLSITAARTVNESSPSAVNDAGTSTAASGGGRGVRGAADVVGAVVVEVVRVARARRGVGRGRVGHAGPGDLRRRTLVHRAAVGQRRAGRDVGDGDGGVVGREAAVLVHDGDAHVAGRGAVGGQGRREVRRGRADGVRVRGRADVVGAVGLEVVRVAQGRARRRSRGRSRP